MSQGTINKTYDPSSKSLRTNPGAADSSIESISAVPLYDLEEFTTATNNTITFSEYVDGILCANDSNLDIIVTIQTKNFIVKAHEVRQITRKIAFNELTLNAGASSFRITGLQRGEPS
jgi:hypothetical protein